MKLIFISGPYRAPTKAGIHKNIMVARKASIKLWQEGWAVICPHMNTAHFDGLADDSVWLDGDLEFLRRCDSIFMLKNWEASIGSWEELKLAVKLNKEIIYQGLL